MWSKVLSLHCVFFLKTGETGRLETHVSVAEAMPERPRGRATRKNSQVSELLRELFLFFLKGHRCRLRMVKPWKASLGIGNGQFHLCA